MQGRGFNSLPRLHFPHSSRTACLRASSEVLIPGLLRPAPGILCHHRAVAVGQRPPFLEDIAPACKSPTDGRRVRRHAACPPGPFALPPLDPGRGACRARRRACWSMTRRDIDRTVASAPTAFRVRVWQVMSRGRGPRAGCPPSESADVAYPLLEKVRLSVLAQRVGRTLHWGSPCVGRRPNL